MLLPLSAIMTRACEQAYFCDTRSPLCSCSPNFPPAPLTLRSIHTLWNIFSRPY